MVDSHRHLKIIFGDCSSILHYASIIDQNIYFFAIFYNPETKLLNGQLIT